MELYFQLTQRLVPNTEFHMIKQICKNTEKKKKRKKKKELWEEFLVLPETEAFTVGAVWYRG